MKCPACQTENRENAKFCNECGHSFAVRAVQPQFDAEPGSEPADPRAALRSIPPVTVEDEGFDFSEACPAPESAGAGADALCEADPAEAQDAALDSVKDVAQDMFPGRFDTGKTAVVGAVDGADKTADLTGLEKLVDSSYVPPAYSGRAGDTMEMPAVGTAAQASRQFRAQMDPKELKKLEKARRKEERGRSRTPLVILVVLIVAVAAAVAGTYFLEMWGGKSVPNVVGQSQTNATYTLESKGFKVRAELVKSDDVDGIVLLTDPAAGSRAEEGAEVVIHVSTSRIVPSVLGKTQDEAKQLLDAEGFDNYAFAPVKSNEAEGTVLSVSVEAGQRALSTTPIEIEVAVAFTVPEVKDLPEADAVSLLEAEGYQVKVLPHYTEEAQAGIATSTDPAAGEKLKSGETVTLYVTKSRGDELVNLTWSYLSSASSFSLDGLSYEVSSVDSVSYAGDNTVEYALTARYFETHYWFGFEAETRYGDYETITGTITWNDSNEIAAADPTIKKL